MSAEIIMDGTYTEAADVFAAGVVLYILLLGQPPFYNELYDFGLVIEILKGLRETPIPNTPKDYVKIYTGKYNLNSITV